MATEGISGPRGEWRPRPWPNSPGKIVGTAAGLVLRLARDEDAAAIVALIEAVWSEYPGKTLAAAADMPELLRPASAYAARGGRFWVVEARGEIIGTIALAPGAMPGVVELQKLYVAKAVRRNGLGSFLCGLVEREARERGAHAIELWSDVKLLDAHRRYRRLGYRRGTVLKTYNDISGTVRFHFRKALEPGLPDYLDRATASPAGRMADAGRWQMSFHPGAGGGIATGSAKP